MKDTKASVQSQFGQVAENYRHSKVHASGADLEWLAQQAQENNYVNALDVGCGAGHASAAIAPHVESVTSLDITETMLEQVNVLATEKNYTNIHTKLGDVENLPFEDSSFDLVITRYSAHHWPNPLAALSETFRVLKPSGRFILIDVVGFETFAEDTFLTCIELLRDISHVRDHSITQWQSYFQETGYSASLIRQWDLLLNFDSWVQRMAVPESRVIVIRDLFETASDDIRQLMHYDGTSFTFQVALFDAYKPE